MLPAPLSQAVLVPERARVLVVANLASPASVEIAEYYRKRRGLTSGQVVSVNLSTSENVSLDEYRTYLEAPVRRAVARWGRVDYIVLTKGVPHKVGDDDPNSSMDGLSADAQLAAMDLPGGQIQDPRQLDQSDAARNPYLGRYEPFDSATFGLRLVTRLDGYTVADAKALVDRSVGAMASAGPVLLDADDNKDGPGYSDVQALMLKGGAALKAEGIDMRIDATRAFVGSAEPLMAYISWGSNDSSFDLRTYRSLRFRPGSIAETFVSTSGRTFQPVSGGQSLIADLVRQGVTGAKGYVSEPYANGLTLPDQLLEHYFGGFNLAESFYAATPFIRWKDVVIGDPLCRPFAKPSGPKSG
jgi:uncharacterized protein (TIGR03790 family)